MDDSKRYTIPNSMAEEELKLLRESFKNLIAQRDLLEIEADAIHSELTSPGPQGEPPAGIKDPLVDDEGFPRGDIDIYNVRNKRSRLATINYDHKELMKQIETMLTKIHELSSLTEKDVDFKPSPSSSSSLTSPVATVEKAYAVLDELLEGSPAAMAGVRDGDLLLRFGTVTSLDPTPLPSIAKLVGSSVNKEIEILVQRNGERLALKLVPKPWGGRGLLGCHLSPCT